MLFLFKMLILFHQVIKTSIYQQEETSFFWARTDITCFFGFPAFNNHPIHRRSGYLKSSDIIPNRAIQAIHNTPPQARLAASHRSPYAGRRPSPCCCQRPGESLRPSPEKRGPGARQSGKGRRWPGKVGENPWQNMAKYGQIWPKSSQN